MCHHCCGSVDTVVNKGNKVPDFMEFIILWEVCPLETNGLKKASNYY